MKVLLINNGPKPLPAVQGGGVETLIQLLIEGIGDKYDLTVVCIYSKKAEEESRKYPKVKFVYLNFNSIVYKMQLLIYYFFNHYIGRDVGNALCNLVRKSLDISKYDVIVSENGVRVGKSLKKYSKGKLVLHLHNDWLNVYTKNATLYKGAYDEIWTISKFLKRRVDAIEGNTPVRVLYNGVDTKLFHPSKKAIRADVRRRYRISNEDIVIANCCRIVEEKGILHTIRAFKKVQEQYLKHHLKLLIIGDISNETAYIRDVKTNASKDIIFTGYVNHDELPYIMGCTDIGIASTVHLNSKYGQRGYEGVIECFNLTVVEFLALGIPVIVTNSGGMPEILEYEFKDYIVDARELKFENELKVKLLSLLEKIEIENMEKKCLQVAGKFTMGNYLNQFNDYLVRNDGKV